MENNKKYARKATKTSKEVDGGGFPIELSLADFFV